MRALSTTWARLRLRTSVHRYAMAVLDDLGHAPLMEPSTGLGVRTTALGNDPIRVLVFGGGLAVGYGVRTRSDAFDGPLVEHLARTTGRGVSLENRAVQHLRVADAARSLGGAGTHSYHVVVWCPSFAEGLEHLGLRTWRRGLVAMVETLREERPVPIVLTRMPVPVGKHPAALLARPWVHRLNLVIDGVAARYDGVVSVATEPFVPGEIGKPVTDAAYFAAVADHIAPAVRSLLPAGARRTPAPVGATVLARSGS